MNQGRRQALGCLLGGALGDAWGNQFEGVAEPQPFRVPQHPFLSDDTQLTLATCESILDCGRVEPENIATHFLRWFRARRIRGMGASTEEALRNLAAGAHWAVAGTGGEFAAGNGAAMRVAPLAFLLNPKDRNDLTVMRDVCRITHHNEEAYAGALAVVLAIRSVLSGEWSKDKSFLAMVVDHLPDSAVRDRIQALLPLELPVRDVARHYGASGYVVDTVPLALYCAHWIAVEPLRAVLARTISAGGDSDTIASIAGQLAGTVVGPAGASQDHVNAIEERDELIAIAELFSSFVEVAGARA